MNDAKPWYQSQTIIAIAATIIVNLIGSLLKTSVSDLQPQIVDGITGLFSLIGAGVAIHGRITATAVITGSAAAASVAKLPPPIDTTKGQRGSIHAGVLMCLGIVCAGLLLAGCTLGLGYIPSPTGGAGAVTGSVTIDPGDIQAIADAIAKARATKASAANLSLKAPPVVPVAPVTPPEVPASVDPKQIAP